MVYSATNALLDAAAAGDVGGAQVALDAGANANRPTPDSPKSVADGRSALMYGKVDIILGPFLRASSRIRTPHHPA